MIQPNELRKGNLFNPISRRTKIHLPQTSVIFEVVEILLFRVTTVLYGTNPAQVESLPEFRYADLSPIPLTPEILEKCGFEKGYDVYSKDSFEIAYIINGFDEVGYVLIINKEAESVIFHYLHQLQNLYFALTGQELDTNLIKQIEKYYDTD